MNDSVLKTLTVSFLVCLFCSLVVSYAAVSLRDMQNLNKLNDQRIKILKSSDDGFFIAEEDLKLRGFGDLIGYQQSGIKNFKFADPLHHEDLFKLAEKYVLDIRDNINEKKYSFLLKLFDKAEIINTEEF